MTKLSLTFWFYHHHHHLYGIQAASRQLFERAQVKSFHILSYNFKLARSWMQQKHSGVKKNCCCFCDCGVSCDVSEYQLNNHVRSADRKQRFHLAMHPRRLRHYVLTTSSIPHTRWLRRRWPKLINIHDVRMSRWQSTKRYLVGSAGRPFSRRSHGSCPAVSP